MRALLRLLVPGRSAAFWALVAALLAIAAAAAGVLLLAASGWLITAAALAGAGLIAGVEVFAPGAVIRAAAIGRTAARYLERLVGHEATFRQLADLRVRAFQRLLRLPIARLDAMVRADAMNRLTRDIDVLDHFIPRLLLPTAATVVVTAVAAVALGRIDAALGWSVAAALLLGGSGTLLAGVSAARAPGERLARATPAMRSALGDWLHGLAELISIGRASEQARGVMDRVDEQLAAQRSQRRVEAGMQAALAAFGYVGFWAVFVLACGLVAQDAVTAPMAAAAALVALGLVDAWQGLAPSWSFFETCRQAGLRVAALGADRPASGGGLAEAGGTDLAAESVRFAYANALEPVLSDVDLRVAAGERVLIRGASGVGKSTLAKLLAGILEPTSGCVRLGGVALDELTEDALRRRIGYLSQDVVLFEDTLRANLFLGDPEPDEHRAHAILRDLGLSALIDQLPDGLDTWVGTHGSTVSGGEGRRLALARLLLADFPVVVLDEPIAGVDRDTAARVAQSLDRRLQDRTVVVLSHDPGVLPAFDRELELTRSGLVPAGE
jgi:ATP-binding cassette subfamily C protein CydC